jgi:ribosomal protein S18 acetylase RimI-like enzyme
MTAIIPTPDLARQTIDASVAAWCDLFDATEGLTHRRIGRGTLFAGLDHLMLNHLVGAPPAAIDEAVHTYRDLGATRFLLSFEERELPRALELGAPHGLVRFRRPWATLATPIDSRRPVASRLRVRAVRVRAVREDDAAEMGALICAAFDLPPNAAPIFTAALDRPRWHVFAAEREGELAGVGMLFVHERVAYLFAGATAPRHRRRGIQRALIAHRIARARDAGARIVGSETGVAVPGEPNPSWHNLERAGLRPVHITEHLCPEGATWSAQPGTT